MKFGPNICHSMEYTLATGNLDAKHAHGLMQVSAYVFYYRLINHEYFSSYNCSRGLKMAFPSKTFDKSRSFFSCWFGIYINILPFPFSCFFYDNS